MLWYQLVISRLTLCLGDEIALRSIQLAELVELVYATDRVHNNSGGISYSVYVLCTTLFLLES
jgi:hypothetical protein